MPIKKSELYASLWASCDELRGGMDASQYKDYVLVLLFVKYVSDRYAGKPNGLLDVPKKGGFADMVALKGDKEIGDKINKIIGRLAEANDLKSVIDVADFNDPDKLGRGQDMVDRLTNLVGIFESPDLDFGGNGAEGDDILGDAYEYLMRHFATESGKSKGQFYTPAEVSRIMAKAIGIGRAESTTETIYDPTCGSGALLLKAHDEAAVDVTIYGQEMDNATRALAKMNMILHDCPSAIIWQDNTLSTPHFKEPNGDLKTFDFVVANPPFSTKAWSSGFNPAEDEYKRFPYGIPPTKNGDYAFLLHVLASLKSTGKGAVIMPHGVLFRGNVEGDIRREIVRRRFIKGIVGLPSNLFYGTGIPACIVVLDKEHANARKGIFMVDASKGFIKEGNKNRLRAQDIHKIVDAFTKQEEIAKYARMVPFSEIEDNDFNLNLPRYIDTTADEDIQDIDAHLRGGIPMRDIDALDAYWKVFPGVRAALFANGDRPGYCQLNVETGDIKTTIFEHPEFKAFNQSVTKLFQKWQAEHAARLKAIAPGDKPKQLIEALAESLLEAFQSVPLINAYDVYQHLMDYWAETMQDDVYIIVADGWKAQMDLVPPELIVARYFTAERAAIEKLEAERDAITARKEESEEEHNIEDGLLADAQTAKGKLTAKSVKDRLKVIRADEDMIDDRKILADYLAVIEEEKAAKRQVDDAQKALDASVAGQYEKLDERDVDILVVNDKWLGSLGAAVESELDHVSQALAGRICQLGERYETPLPNLSDDVDTATARVEKHLRRMGATWN